MTRHTAVLTAAAVLAVAGLAWLAGARHAANTALPGATPSPVAKPAPAAPPAVAAAAAPAPLPTPHAGGEGPEDGDAKLLDALGKLESKFQAEPISPQWAYQQEAVIAKAFAPETLARDGAPAPLDHEAHCRSTTCRVAATYRNAEDSRVAQLFVLGHLASNLPRTMLAEIPGADGTMQLVFYADAGTKVPAHLTRGIHAQER